MGLSRLPSRSDFSFLSGSTGLDSSRRISKVATSGGGLVSRLRGRSGSVAAVFSGAAAGFSAGTSGLAAGAGTAATVSEGTGGRRRHRRRHGRDLLVFLRPRKGIQPNFSPFSSFTFAKSGVSPDRVGAATGEGAVFSTGFERWAQARAQASVSRPVWRRVPVRRRPGVAPRSGAAAGWA